MVIFCIIDPIHETVTFRWHSRIFRHAFHLSLGLHTRKDWMPYKLWFWILRQETFPHDDVIKWKHFPRNWPFVREIHRSPVNFPHKGQWRGALMFSLIYAWINDWVNNRKAGDLRRQHGHYDVIIMFKHKWQSQLTYIFMNRPTCNWPLSILKNGCYKNNPFGTTL